jgi:hypothetical protein
MGPKAKIAQIDQQIDANRAQLVLHQGFDELCAGCWQSAWDRHPELATREQELFRQRGVAQQEADLAAHKEWLRDKRSERAKHVRRRAA